MNKPLADSRTIRQDSSSGHKDNQNGISPFTDFLESSIKEMVVDLPIGTAFWGYDNNIHKHRNKALTEELRIRERLQYC